MENERYILHSQRVVLPNGVREAWILIENGRIGAVLEAALAGGDISRNVLLRCSLAVD